MTPSSGPEPPLAVSIPPGQEPIMVHVLYMDIVDSTRETADQQRLINERLANIVANTQEFKEARERDELISIATGDGNALVFLQKEFEAPLRCAIEIARALRADPICELRMGIHSGPVYTSPDINGMLNVAGAGINIAARVMSCGGSGHILISANAAEPLRNLSAWKDKLWYLGEYRAKKDRIHIWNFLDGEIGSSAPLKVPSWRTIVRRRFFVAGAVSAAVIGGAVVMQHRPPMPARSMTYSLMVKDRNGQVQEFAPDAVPRSGSVLKLKFGSTQEGFLYIVAEGANASKGRSWSWLFPEPGYQSGSGELPAGRPISIPTPPDAFIEFSGEPGEEIVYIIWSDKPLEKMEVIKRSLFTRLSDELSPEEGKSVATLIGAAPSPDQSRLHTDTTVQGTGPVLVTHFTLGHM